MLNDFLATYIKNIYALAFMCITVYTNYSCTYFYVYSHHLCLILPTTSSNAIPLQLSQDLRFPLLGMGTSTAPAHS